LKNFITTEIIPEDDLHLEDDAPLLSTGVINSVSVMKLVTFMEETFGFEFEPYEVDQDYLDSIDKMVEFVQGKL
jgi:acyl carrier protein